jgi:hypothetical protein
MVLHNRNNYSFVYFNLCVSIYQTRRHIVDRVRGGGGGYPYFTASTLNYESKQICNYEYKIRRTRRVAEDAFGIATQTCRLFYDKIQLSPKNR